MVYLMKTCNCTWIYVKLIYYKIVGCMTITQIYSIINVIIIQEVYCVVSFNNIF